MWDEEINKKIKDAADQYHPAYDDTAWNKMEQMLNEHLPRKKDRRRIIYFLPFIALLTGIIFFVIFHKEIIPLAKNPENSLLKSIPVKAQTGSAKVSSGETTSATASLKGIKDKAADVEVKNGMIKQYSSNAANPGIKKVHGLSVPGNVATGYRNTQQRAENLPGNKDRQKEHTPQSIQAGANTTSRDINGAPKTIPQTAKPSDGHIPSPVITDDNTQVQQVKTPATNDEKETLRSKDVAKAEDAKNANDVTKQKKIKRSFIHNFGFGLSAGPDISGVKLSNTGKVTIAYGGLVSYSVSNRFTLRTGFFIAEKIYSAGKDDYYASSGSTWNTNLQRVDANCKVYEVPLTVSYNFSKTKNHSLFASVGLSSYFMKRESYVYYYKNSADSTYSWPWTVQNKNKHYFSVLDISAGYEYFINKRFSITGEPYLKLPLSGIGAGKIKLNSAGIIFTAAIKPF